MIQKNHGMVLDGSRNDIYFIQKEKIAWNLKYCENPMFVVHSKFQKKQGDICRTFQTGVETEDVIQTK